MSYQMQERVMETHTIPNPLKLTLRAIAKFTDDNGRGAFASHGTYSEVAGKSRRTVVRDIKQLLELGVLIDTGKIKKRCKVYNIHLVQEQPTPDREGQESTPEKTREELEAEVADLKAQVQDLRAKLQDVTEQTSCDNLAQDKVKMSHVSQDTQSVTNQARSVTPMSQDHVTPMSHKPVIEPSITNKNSVSSDTSKATDQQTPVELVQEHPLFQAFEEALGHKQYVDPDDAQSYYTQACQMHTQGITPDEVSQAVQAKRKAGKKMFRFTWVGEWVNDLRNSQPVYTHYEPQPEPEPEPEPEKPRVLASKEDVQAFKEKLKEMKETLFTDELPVSPLWRQAQ